MELSKVYFSRTVADDENEFMYMVDVDYALLPSKCERCGGHLKHRVKHYLQSASESLIVTTDLSENSSNSVIVVAANETKNS